MDFIKKIVITIIILISIKLLIFNRISIHAYWILYCALFSGFLLGIVWVYELTKQIIYIRIFGWIGLFSTIFSVISPPFIFQKNKLAYIFESNTSVKIDTLFEDNEKHYIFGIDKTQYQNSPRLNDDLIKIYKYYLKENGIIREDSLPVFYRDYSIAKVCYDIKQKKNENGTFEVVFFGSELNIYDYNDFKESNIVAAIETVYNFNEFSDNKTLLDKYYKHIRDVVKNSERDNNTFTDYVIFTYSDFIQDVYDEKVDNSINDIESLRNGKKNDKSIVNSSILENLYILPSNRSDNTSRKCIIEASTGTPYLRNTFVEKDIDLKNIQGNSFDNLKYIKIIIQSSAKQLSPLELIFEDVPYSVRLVEKNTFSDVYLLNIKTDQKISLLKTTNSEITEKGTYAVKFKNDKIENPILDISKNNNHVLLQIDSEYLDFNPELYKFLIVLVFVIMGLVIPITIARSILIIKKIYQNETMS